MYFNIVSPPPIRLYINEREREKGQITRHDIILNFTDDNIMFTKLIADSDNKILQDNISFNGTYLKGTKFGVFPIKPPYFRTTKI